MYQVSAYNGYSVTITCYFEYCSRDTADELLLLTEAQRICGRDKKAEFVGAHRQYGVSELLYLCLPG